MIPTDSFTLGPLRIYYYSLCLLAAVWLAYVLVQRQAKTIKLPAQQLADLLLLTLVAGVIGARLGFIVQNLSYYANHLEQIWWLRSGGLSIHGAVIGGLLAVVWYARRQQLPLLQLTDTLALPLLAGQIVGRFGNYFNQELFGYPTTGPFAMPIDSFHRPAEFQEYSTFHPTFLYEIILNGLGLALLNRVPLKKRGLRTALYLIIFAISRFIVEIWRISDRLIGPLSLAQLISLPVLILGILLWQRQQKAR